MNEWKSSCDIKPSKCADCLSLPEGGTVSLSSPPSPVLWGGGWWLETSSGSKWAPPTAANLVCVCVLLGGSHDPCVLCPSLTRWVSGFWLSKWFVVLAALLPTEDKDKTSPDRRAWTLMLLEYFTFSFSICLEQDSKIDFVILGYCRQTERTDWLYVSSSRKWQQWKR